MKVYRISRKAFIADLSGEGARLYGGRWNKKGTSALYVSENRALATVEYLVHLPFALVPKDVCIAEIEVPDGQKFEVVNAADFPIGWSAYPAPMSLAEIGDAWTKRNETLMLKVPSAVVKNEWNCVINPRHAAFSEVRIAFIEEYAFDPRLIK